MMMSSPSQSGSAFFIILIAIALFAALSYALMQNSRGNVSSLSSEQARMAAQEIVGYSDTITTAFQKLRLRGCTENQISVKHAVEFSWSSYTNASSPSDKSCWIYDAAGANVMAQPAPALWFDPGSASTNKYWAYNPQMAITGAGSTAPELILALAGLKKEVCIKINDILSVGDKGQDPVSGNYFDSLGFDGTFAAAGYTLNNATLNDKTAFCMVDSDNWYKYVRVVLVR